MPPICCSVSAAFLAVKLKYMVRRCGLYPLEITPGINASLAMSSSGLCAGS